MVSTIGIDSRNFVRNSIKSNHEKGHFESVLGIAIKVKDYLNFLESYKRAIAKSIRQLKCDKEFLCYCFNDIKNCEGIDSFFDSFFEEIKGNIEKIHVFYTLFSKKRLRNVKVYGRMSKEQKIKLSEPTRSYEKLVSSHLIQCFPAICAWRLTEYLEPSTIEFHLDAYEGHIFEAQEMLDDSKFQIKVFPGGDCVNPIISTADLMIEFLDRRLKKNNKLLIFENIRPALPEFGEKVLVYPISNKHLTYITPLEKKTINITKKIRHPVFWFFKGEEIINSEIIKKSESYRNLQDFAANKYGVVKMFNKSQDIDYFQNGDYGVYVNSRGKEQIESYLKFGKNFKLFDLDNLVPKNLKK